MLKLGKEIKLKPYNEFKLTYGTVNTREPKSIYFELSTWVKPEYEMEWETLYRRLNKVIEYSINEGIDDDVFYSRYILEVDLRIHRMQKNKKSYLSINVNLYNKLDTQFNKNNYYQYIKNITDNIISNITTIDDLTYSLQK